MIVLNSLRDEGAGFGGDTNRIKIITKTDETDFPIKTKNEVAKDILDAIETRLSNNQANITF
jgi:phosphopantothenoylcysteine decarboxylase/phosphopantothenate--cysteine ligase